MGMFSRRSAGCLVLAAGLALTLTEPSLAQSLGQEVTISDQKQLVESLRSGGYVIVVRHGATFSDRADSVKRGLEPYGTSQKQTRCRDYGNLIRTAATGRMTTRRASH